MLKGKCSDWKKGMIYFTFLLSCPFSVSVVVLVLSLFYFLSRGFPWAFHSCPLDVGT